MTVQRKQGSYYYSWGGKQITSKKKGSVRNEFSPKQELGISLSNLLRPIWCTDLTTSWWSVRLHGLTREVTFWVYPPLRVRAPPLVLIDAVFAHLLVWRLMTLVKKL